MALLGTLECLYSSPIDSHSFLSPWLVSQLLTVCFLLPSPCCTGWCRQPGVQVLGSRWGWHSSWHSLTNHSAANFESTCPSAFSSHLVIEGFLLFVGGFFLFFLIGRKPKPVLCKPDSPGAAQLCDRSQREEQTHHAGQAISVRLAAMKTDSQAVKAGDGGDSNCCWPGRTPISLLHWQIPQRNTAHKPSIHV